ncbi:L-asparagine permease [Yersinia pestis]|nr:L-asparagine permease [Yersinia pestis]
MMSGKHSAETHHAAKKRWLDSHDTGYHKSMGLRHIQMIAIGGSIGTGLFLGTGARLQMAGPALALVYLVCGIFFIFHSPGLGGTGLTSPYQRQLCFLRP